MRCFISIKIPEETIKEVLKAQEELPEFFGKKTELENLHLTLKFLGEIEESKVEEVKNKLREIKFKKFEGKLNKVGFFSKKYIRIIWISIMNCSELQKIIDEKLKNLFGLEKRFMGHLTIARIKEIKNKEQFLKKLEEIKVFPIKFSIDCFYLMSSELTKKGPQYKILETYFLKN